ncbi:MAG: BstXI family restriction endonuclease [Candidatus Paceibacterota bacterium]
MLDRKIYKTGQTRGADDDVIFQNRVGRNSTVLIPFQFWNESFAYPDGETSFENGFIVLLTPSVYFEDKNIADTLKNKSLRLGENCLVFYETRADWDKYNPSKLKWSPAESRISPLGGNYVARVPATTADK